MQKIAYLTLFTCVFSHASAIQWCSNAIETTETETAFEFIGDGSQVLHKTTGLQWKRCLEGQEFDNNATVDYYLDDKCNGKATAFSRKAALQAANEDGYRLPNIKELASLVEKRCKTPAINLSVFPNHDSVWVWSATFTDRVSPYYVFSINFELGNVGGNAEDSYLHLLVTP